MTYWAHFSDTDKGGQPYIVHPVYIALQLQDEKEKIVALLHDTVEDKRLNLDIIEREFGEEIAEAVDAISRREGEKYFDYIERVKQNTLAKKVKIEDLKHNSDISRIPDAQPEDFSLLKRYEKALKILQE